MHYVIGGDRIDMGQSHQIFSIDYKGRTETTFAIAYHEFLRLPILEKIKDDNDTLADLLNKVDQTGQRYILHTAGYFRGGQGNGGVTWADKKETTMDMLKGYHQVVGHTPVTRIESIRHIDSSVTYIDLLDTSNCFHEVDC
jgi:hypothetical protein